MGRKLGKLQFRIICLLGRHFKFVRKWYWENYGPAFPWGLYKFIEDDYNNEEPPPYKTGSMTMDDYKKMYGVE